MKKNKKSSFIYTISETIDLQNQRPEQITNANVISYKFREKTNILTIIEYSIGYCDRQTTIKYASNKSKVVSKYGPKYLSKL